MFGVARVGDKTFGICSCHKTPIAVSGTIVIGSQDTFSEDRPVARIGDTVVASCGHTGKIVTGAGELFVNDIPVARLGDRTVGCYVATIVLASDMTLSSQKQLDKMDKICYNIIMFNVRFQNANLQ